MTYSLPGHPAGATGVALLLLRLSAASAAYAAYEHAAAAPAQPWLMIGLLVAGALLVLGLGTRAAALASALVAIAAALRMGGGWPAALLALDALNFGAIALLGAGAYSIDARLFGRRVIEVR